MNLPLYLVEAEWEGSGLTAGADEDNFSPEDAERIIQNVFNLGWERIRQMNAAGMKEHRDGGFYMPHCSISYGSGFAEEANYNIVKEEMPWLGIQSNGEVLGRGVIPEDSDLERYLAKVSDEDWEKFIDSLNLLNGDGYGQLDSDATQELVQAEEWRWMKEDGTPEFYKALRAKATNSFTVFALEHMTSSMVWQYCREKEAYPEQQDNDSVWMNMDELAEEPDAIEFMMEQLRPRMARLKRMWPLIKRRFYFEHEIDKLLDGLIRKNMPLNSPMHAFYAAMDDDGLFRFFLSLTPDTAWNDSTRPFWQPEMTEGYGHGEQWICAPLSTVENGLNHRWKLDLTEALDALLQQGELNLMAQSAAPSPPADHPELPLGEAAEELGDVDPEHYIHGTGGLRLTPLYSDDLIEIVQPRDKATVDTLMRQREGWFEHASYGARHPYVVVLDRQTHQPLGTYMDEFGNFDAIGKDVTPPIKVLLKDPKYGEAVRRGFLMIARAGFRKSAEDDSEQDLAYAVPHLLTFGGARELQRKMSGKYGFRLKDYGMIVGIALARAGKYKQAAKYLGLDAKDITPKGVWLYYGDYDDLAGLFKYEEAAEEVFAGETHHWFDYMWERGFDIDIKEAAEWIDKEAKAYLRDLLINRKVYFPDAGENKQGEFIKLTRQLLKDYTDDQLLDWVVDPTQEDLDDGVFDDIREAIVDGAKEMLAGAGSDQAMTGYMEKVRQEYDVIEAKYVDHPTKKGSDQLAFLVPWGTIVDAFDKMAEDDALYTNTVYGLLMDAHAKNIDNERNDDYGSWPKSTDPSADHYGEQCSRRLLELEPMREQEDPKQIVMPFKESIDDPPDDLAKWVDEAPAQVQQNLLPVVQQVGQRLGLNPRNIQIRFDRTVIYPKEDPYSKFMIEFDADIKPPGPTSQRPSWYNFAETLTHHVIDAMAQAGYVVNENTWYLDQTSRDEHLVYVWMVDRAKWQ
jgi:hypothetical protein